MQEIEIADLLKLEDFTILTLIETTKSRKDYSKICESMNFKISTSFVEKSLNVNFYGVYVGQSALNFPAEKINYLTNKVIENAKVSYLTDNGYIQKEMYDFNKAYGKDGYQFFLSGNQAIITIENETCETNKELIIFRDSFGSSLSSFYRRI